MVTTEYSQNETTTSALPRETNGATDLEINIHSPASEATVSAPHQGVSDLQAQKGAEFPDGVPYLRYTDDEAAE
jgi:hypothetical protein